MQAKKYPAVCPHCHRSVALAGQAKGVCTNSGCGKRLPEVGKEVVLKSAPAQSAGSAYIV